MIPFNGAMRGHGWRQLGVARAFVLVGLALMLGLSARVLWLDLGLLPTTSASPWMGTDFFLARALGSPGAVSALRARLAARPADQVVVAIQGPGDLALTVPYTARYLSWPGAFRLLDCREPTTASSVLVPPRSLLVGDGTAPVRLAGTLLDPADLRRGLTSPDQPTELACAPPT